MKNNIKIIPFILCAAILISGCSDNFTVNNNSESNAAVSGVETQAEKTKAQSSSTAAETSLSETAADTERSTETEPSVTEAETEQVYDMWSVLPYIDETPVSELEYSKSYEGIIVTGYKGASDAVRIPEMIDNTPVKGVKFYPREDPFDGSTEPYVPPYEIRELIVPDTITWIEVNPDIIEYMNIPVGAYYRLAGLGNISYDVEYASLKGLFLGADFFNSSFIKKCKDIEVVKNGKKYTYSELDELDKVCIPCLINEDVEYGAELIGYIDCCKEFTIPDGVVSIGAGAFTDCKLLESIIIPDSVEIIKTGIYASAPFTYCDSLRKVTIGNGIRKIDSSAFSGADVKTLIIETKNNIMDARTDVSGEPEKNVVMCELFPKLETLIIKNGSETIPNGFYNMSSLTDVELPDTLKEIGNSAFSGCTVLTSITIPDSVTSIGSDAFRGCSDLSNVTLSKSLKDIPEGVFAECSSLEKIIIPEGVISIGIDDYHSTGTFYRCSSLEEVILPATLKSIGNAVFCECPSLSTVELPDSLESVGGIWYVNGSVETGGGIPFSSSAFDDNVFLIYNGKGYSSDEIAEILSPVDMSLWE